MASTLRSRMGRFGRRFSIMVCKDGIVSILEAGSQKNERRLGAALPMMSVDDVLDAFELIRRLCTLTRIAHGHNTGTLIEPRITEWTRSEATLHDIDVAADMFMSEYRKLLREKTRKSG